MHHIQYNVGSPWSSQFYLACDVIFGKKIRLQDKWNFPSVYIDLFAFLSLIGGFPGASKGGKIKLTPMQVNFVVLFLLPLQHLKLLGLFWSQAYAIKCVKKANFLYTQRTRNVLSTCKNISAYRLNFKTKVIDNIPK